MHEIMNTVNRDLKLDNILCQSDEIQYKGQEVTK